MIIVDFVTAFSPNAIAEPDSSLAKLLEQLEGQNTTLALATSRRGLINQVNSEAIAETIEVTARHPRLLPVGTLDPRRYVGWREDLRSCVEGGCVAIRFSPGMQSWSPNTMLFAEMVGAIGTHELPIIVDFEGTASESSAWIHRIADVTHRHGVPVVLNELAYNWAGELFTVMHKYANVHAGIRRLSLVGSLENVVAEGLSDRFVFASCAPKHSVRGLLNQVLMAQIPDKAKQAILGDNALRLLKLGIDHLPSRPLQIDTVAELPVEPIIDVHAHVSGFPLPQPDDLFEQSTVPENSERCNIEITIVSSYHAINYDMRVGNEQTRSFLQRYDNLRGYVVGDARDIPGSVEQMDQYFKDPRFVGVKLYCPFAGNMATLRTQELLDEIARFGRPVKIHMDPGGSPYAGVRQAAERNPDLIIIKAHGDDAEGAVQVEDLSNVYFEFASSGITAGKIRRSTDVLGPERILFGSDQQILAPWYQLGAYLDAIKDEGERDLIFRKNPRRIFDLGID